MLHNSGTLSTIFLWMVDVQKSRVECEVFILAEANRKAFEASTSATTTYQGNGVGVGNS